MFPSKAVRTSPHIDGFLFQRDVFASSDCISLSLGIIWRGVFPARSFEVLHKNRLPKFQGEIKMRGVMWGLLAQLFPLQKAVAHPLLLLSSSFSVSDHGRMRADPLS
jgi:hypothetical protein